MQTTAAVGHSRLYLWAAAFTGFYRPTADDVARLDPVSKFLYASRSIILVISAQAAIIAGLLAVIDGKFDLLRFLMVLVGFVVAHMISNLSNDYFGWKRGHDTPDSPRMRYTVHPLSSGVLDTRTLLTGLAVLSVIGLAITAGFIVDRGMTTVAFAASGIALLFLYDAAPTPLKAIGLGELASFLVWGPLMIAGGYAMIAGTVPAVVWLAAIPHGLGVMSILVGKHIDQREFDASRNLKTLPVLLGDAAARQVALVSIVLMYAATLGLAFTGRLPPEVCLAGFAAPHAIRALRTLSAARPAEPPAGYVGWPLWYHRWCLRHNRAFGWLFIAGLAIAAARTAITA